MCGKNHHPTTLLLNVERILTRDGTLDEQKRHQATNPSPPLKMLCQDGEDLQSHMFVIHSIVNYVRDSF